MTSLKDKYKRASNWGAVIKKEEARVTLLERPIIVTATRFQNGRDNIRASFVDRSKASLMVRNMELQKEIEDLKRQLELQKDKSTISPKQGVSSSIEELKKMDVAFKSYEDTVDKRDYSQALMKSKSFNLRELAKQ